MACRRLLFPAFLAACLLATACAHQSEPEASTAPPPMTEPKAPAETPPPAETTPLPEAEATPVACTDPRPQACTMDYRPVCATRDTGIRCVTTPCPSSEQKTFGNACSACGDPKVSQYVKGECPAG
ncbi:hypothetical protein [Arenimonas sp.]|uniref:hypothetical protein n=1 Tax=Arenimonas sp. TaxID=1872635 RepID=UPI0039E50F88